MRSAAPAKAVPRSDCRAADIAVMPPPSASSVRKADATAFPCLVPDDFALSGFELGMCGSEGGGGIVFDPAPLLSTGHFAMRRGGPALNGSLTIIVLTSLTTFSADVPVRPEHVGEVYELAGVFLS